MRGPLRLKLALGVLLVLLLGTVSSSQAQEQSNLVNILQREASPSLTLSTVEDINNFLTTHYMELTPDERELLQKALQARMINDGEGSFLHLPAVRQAEIVGQVINGLFSALWPTFDENGQALSPGVLGHLAGWTDAVLESPEPVTAGQMLASLNPARTRTAMAGRDNAFRDLELGTETLRGFSDLVASYWGVCRNFAYALLTIVLVVFGFMIMLRQNIEPRVTMTITNALPRVAAALVLITFSFAISGLIVDVGRVADGLIKSSFGPSQGPNHNIYSLLKAVKDIGLTNIGASLESTEYVWEFDEDSLDADHPEWRCDYHPSCFGTGCQQADGAPCEDFYCPQLPFGGLKFYNCRITIFKRDIAGYPVDLHIDLIDPLSVPPGCGRGSLPNDDPQYRSGPCCNMYSPAKCHGDTNPWKYPFPRNWINTWEMWINRIIVIIVSSIINFLFFFTLLSTILGLLFKMITCFAMWFVLAIVSPLVFMWATIPGQEDTAGTWAKNMLANVLAFPAVNFVINLAFSLAEGYKDAANAPANYPSILFIGPKAAVGLLVAYGIFLMTPSIPDLIKDIIGVKGGKGPGLPDMGKQVKRLPLVGGLIG